jgi:pimeloyl-ACP methyl ester carboxylesterase
VTSLERRRSRISAGELSYVEEGEGPVVVLLHGFPANADLWRNLAPLLAPRFRVVAPDLIGYGGSTKPEGADLSLSAQAGYVRELLQLLDVEAFAAVGHGAGGGIAQLLAVDGDVRALVLLDVVTLDRWATPEMQPGLVDDGTSPAPATVEGAVREVFARGMGHPERLLPEDLELFVRPWREDPSALVRAARAAAREPPSSVVGRIGDRAIPMLVVWGEDDPWLPPSLAERLQDEIGDAAVALLPGCSHFVLEDAPETVAPIVFEFLRLRHLGERHGHGPAPTPVELGVSFERPPEPAGLPDEEQ